MPRWSIITLTAVFLAGFAAVGWAWVQAFINHRAVIGDQVLRDYTRTTLIKMSGMLVAQGALATVGLMSMPSPRPDWARLVSTLSLVILALVLSWMSFHEYLTMRKQIEDDGDS